MRASHKDTEKELALRRWVASRLRKEVDQAIWEQVKDDGYVDAALNPNDIHLREDLLYEVKRLLKFKRRIFSIEPRASGIGGEDSNLQKQDKAYVPLLYADKPIHKRRAAFMPLQRQNEASSIPASADDPVRKRGESFTLYLAKIAAEDNLVEWFRQRVLEGGSVSYEEAVALVDSPAAAVFSLEWFEENSVPFIGHNAQVLEGSEWPPEEHSYVQGRIKVWWDCGQLVSPFAGVVPFRSLTVLLVDAGSVWFRELEVLEDSVLGVLSKLAQQTWRYPWWHPVDIPIFVLIGVARIVGLPYTNHVESRSRLYDPITINVPPWFSVENVSQVYKSLKKDLPTKPQPSPRRLALFEFIMKQPEVTVPGEGGIPKVPSWAALVRSWNESLPARHEWRYKDRRNLRRDFLKAFDQIVNYYRGTA